MERDTEIEQLAGVIAKRLGAGWSVSVTEYGNVDIDCKDGRQLSISRPYREKERVHVSASGWPSYTTVARDWRERRTSKTRVTPGDLYPRESAPDATIALARGADTICKEIARRVMAEYARIWGLCVEHAHNAQARQDAIEASWARVCKAAGVSSDKPSVDLCGGIDIRPSDGTSCYADRGGSIDIDDAIAIIELMRARKASKKGAA